MFTVLSYPVSIVMRAWHWILSTAVGPDNSLGWILSIVLIVVTVRGILVYPTWRSAVSGRQMALVRADIRYIAEYFPEDKEARGLLTRLLLQQRKVNAAAGCAPALVQIPVLLGMYHMLLNFVPRGINLSGPITYSNGALTSAQVASFLNSSIFGVPIATYFSMNDATLVALGTDRTSVTALALPMIIIASAITAYNLHVSRRRVALTTDRQNKVGRNVLRLIIVMSIIGPLFPLIYGLFAPLPIAILIYWLANNGWTFLQNLVLYRTLDRVYPLDAGWESRVTVNPQILAQVKAQLAQNRAQAAKLRRESLPATINGLPVAPPVDA